MKQFLFILGGAVAALLLSSAVLQEILCQRTAIRRPIPIWLMVGLLLIVAGTLLFVDDGANAWNNLLLGALVLVAAAFVYGHLILAQTLRNLASSRMMARVERIAQEDRLPELEQELRQEIEARGSTPDRLNLLAGCLGRQNKWHEALELYRQLRQDKETGSAYLSSVGFAHWKLGNVDEALALSEEAVRKHPDQPVYFMRYAQVLAGLGRLDEAEQALARAEELFAPYRDSRGAWQRAWAKLLAETRNVVEQARILAQSSKTDA